MSSLNLSEMAPDWRWARAEYEYEREQRDDLEFTPSSDVMVRLAKRFLETWNMPELNGAPVRELMPDLCMIYDLSRENSPGCTKHALEAALLARADSQFIMENIHSNLTPLTVQVYSMLFFDVGSGRLDSPFWVEKFIFSPATELPSRMKNSGLIWKVVGYWGGQERLLKDCIRGNAYEDKDTDWIIKHVVSQNMKETLQYVHRGDKLPKELTVPVHHRNLGSWDDKVNKMAELNESGLLEQDDDIKDGMAVFRKKIKMTTDAKESNVEAEEKIDNGIYVYTEEDLQS